MSTMRTLGGLVLITLMTIAGCDKKEPAKPTAPKPPPPDVTPRAVGGAGVVPMASSSGSPGKAPPATSTQPTTIPAQAAAISGGSAQKMKEAGELLGKAVQSLKETRLEDARAALDKVEAMKDSLPEGIRKELVSVRASLDSIEKQKNAAPALPADPDNK